MVPGIKQKFSRIMALFAIIVLLIFSGSIAAETFSSGECNLMSPTDTAHCSEPTLPKSHSNALSSGSTTLPKRSIDFETQFSIRVPTALQTAAVSSTSTSVSITRGPSQIQTSASETEKVTATAALATAAETSQSLTGESTAEEVTATTVLQTAALLPTSISLSRTQQPQSQTSATEETSALEEVTATTALQTAAVLPTSTSVSEFFSETVTATVALATAAAAKTIPTNPLGATEATSTIPIQTPAALSTTRSGTFVTVIHSSNIVIPGFQERTTSSNNVPVSSEVSASQTRVQQTKPLTSDNSVSQTKPIPSAKPPALSLSSPPTISAENSLTTNVKPTIETLFSMTRSNTSPTFSAELVSQTTKFSSAFSNSIESSVSLVIGNSGTERLSQSEFLSSSFATGTSTEPAGEASTTEQVFQSAGASSTLTTQVESSTTPASGTETAKLTSASIPNSEVLTPQSSESSATSTSSASFSIPISSLSPTTLSPTLSTSKPSATNKKSSANSLYTSPIFEHIHSLAVLLAVLIMVYL